MWGRGKEEGGCYYTCSKQGLSNEHIGPIESSQHVYKTYGDCIKTMVEVMNEHVEEGGLFK